MVVILDKPLKVVRMKRNDFMDYDTPLLEVVDVQVEQGFAVSDLNYPGWGEEEEL